MNNITYLLLSLLLSGVIALLATLIFFMTRNSFRFETIRLEVSTELHARMEEIRCLRDKNAELDRDNTGWIEANDALEKQIEGLMAQNKNLMDELEKAKKFIAF